MLLKQSANNIFQALKQIIINHKFLISIFIIALLFRIVGIYHTFPLILHPDEPTLVRSTMGMQWFINPGHFDWPHMHFYLNFLLYVMVYVFRGGLDFLGLQPYIEPLIPLLWDSPLIFYFTTRFFNIILGAATVIPIYFTGKHLFNHMSGLFAALLFAIFPFHVWHSHYALIDVPMIFWFSWALFFMIMAYKNPSLKAYVLSGAFVGLAASTKYNGVLVALVLVIVALFSKKTQLISNAKWLVAAGFTSMVTFLIGTPFALFDFKTFIRTDGPKGALWQFTNVGRVDFTANLEQAYDVFSNMLVSDIGLGVIVLFLLTLLFLPKLKNKKEVILLILPIFIFLIYISGSSKIENHYFMILNPFFALICGYVLSVMADHLRHKKHIFIILLILVMLPSLFGSFQKAYSSTQNDSRNYLHDFLENSLEEDDVLVYSDDRVWSVFEGYKNKKLRGSEPSHFDNRKGLYIRASKNEFADILTAEGRSDVYLIKEITPAKFEEGPFIQIYAFNNTNN